CYLDKKATGQGVLEDAKQFFKYGFSFWQTPGRSLLSGCIFQASLVGLEKLK
ncbi:hypothetical protein MKX03_033316, partial [Papaver bracteatum]